jgi:hypothetical protein
MAPLPAPSRWLRPSRMPISLIRHRGMVRLAAGIHRWAESARIRIETEA